MIRQNSVLRKALGDTGVRFLEDSTGAIERLLPHVNVSLWKERLGILKSRAAWASSARRAIRVDIGWTVDEAKRKSRGITALVSRRKVLHGAGSIARTLNESEKQVCDEIVKRISEVLRPSAKDTPPESLQALKASFDEHIVASHLQRDCKYGAPVGEVLRSLRTLAEQTYENKSMAFACILEERKTRAATVKPLFPHEFLRMKKYRALTDGFRSAYLVSAEGSVKRFLDLRSEQAGARDATSGFYPEWAADLARLSRERRLGLCLTRAGDILVFHHGQLIFSYRFGRWHYWNHNH